MRIFGFALLAFVVGLVVGWIAAATIGFGYMEYANVFDRDGGMSMGIIFFIGPAVGIVCGLIAAVVTASWLRRRARNPEASRARRSAPSGVRAAIGILIGALIGYFATNGILWLIGPLAFESYYAALSVSLTPLVAAVLLAAAGWRIAR